MHGRLLALATGLLFALTNVGVATADPIDVGSSASFVWDPVRDWQSSPNEANPSPDSYGNDGVWSYRGSDGFGHDPATYALLPRYATGDGSREDWSDPAFVNLLVGRLVSPQAVFMHSFGGRVIDSGRNAILAWTSPVEGRVSIRGEVRLVPLAACPLGTGIIWSIDRGSEPLQTVVLPAGGGTTFDLSATVRRGETLYFIHDPGFDSNCDSAFLELAISKPAAGAADAGGANAQDIPTTGTQITLGNCVASPCESSYPAGEPFFVRHGFVTDGTEEDLQVLLDPETRFELTVDGQAVPSIVALDVKGDPPSKLYISNFRFGMAGVHTFVGCWYSDGVLQYCGTRTITFTE